MFGNTNIATPSTSTPANNNVFAFNKPSTNSGNIFGNNNVSTPSPGNPSGFSGAGTSQPTVNLFGNSSNNTNTQTSTPQSNSIFGSKPQNAAGTFNSQGSLFGNAQPNSGIGGSSQQSNGLFGINNGQTNTSLPASGITASTTVNSGSLFGGSSKPGQQSGSLFDNKTKAGSLGSETTDGRNLFGNSSTTNSLFGNKSVAGGAGAPSTSLFSGSNTNPVSGSLLAGKSNGVNSLFSSGSGLAHNQQQGNQSQTISSNPYGMQINSGPILAMPESITVPQHSQTGGINEERKLAKISSVSASATELSSLNNSSLIGKLSSHLKSLKGREASHGLFSPSSSMMLKQENLAPISRDDETEGSAKLLGCRSSVSFLFKKNDWSDIKRLTIDSNRSASKKMRLLNGSSSTTRLKSLGEKKGDNECEPYDLLTSSKDDEATNSLENSAKAKKVANKCDYENEGYWCSPSIEQMKKFSREQLESVSDFVVGRQGYGSINFDYDVDLTVFAEDFEKTMFGVNIIFNENKTVEVYPDEDSKPPVGYGLNVPATITLQNVYPVDRKTKEPIKDNSKVADVQYFVKRLRNMKDMEFISYNPFGGIWVFRVKHFSIWGLVNEEDIEIDEDEATKDAANEIKNRTIALPRRPLISKNAIVPGMFDPYEKLAEDSNISGVDSMKDNESLPVIPFLDQMSTEEDDLSLIIKEKPYEPSDVAEEDLHILDTSLKLKISSNWLNQLELASSKNFSIFNCPTEVKKLSKNAVDDLLFPSFKRGLHEYQKIREERKLSGEINFGKFTKNCKILRKGGGELSGCKQVGFKSTLQINKSAFDSVFSNYLNTAVIKLRDNKYPIVQNCSLNFHDIAQAYSNVPNEFRILELASILFDPISLGYAAESETVEIALIKKAKYEKICSWIVKETKPEIDGLLERTTGLQRIYLLLAKNDIVEAAKEAMNTKNKHLSVMISLLGSNDPGVRAIAESQLSRWKSLNANVDPAIFKIYELLAGNSLGHSIGNTEASTLPWLTIVGLQLFYGDIDSFTLEELVLNCLENSLLLNAQSADPLVLNIFKLFSSYSTPVETLLDELKSTADLFDSRLSWFFTHIIGRNDISDAVRDRVTLQFVEQLKVDTMLKEALFVSCFLTNDTVAREQIDLLLSSEIAYFTSTDNIYILKRLEIPQSVAHQHLAQFDKYNNDCLSEVQNLLKAGDFREAEQVVLKRVGPELIIASFGKIDSLNLLSKLLNKFPRDRIAGWERGLGVFENYLKLTLYEEEDTSVIERLISTLPNLQIDYYSSEMVGVVCSLISEKVSQLYLAKNRGQITEVAKEKLLSLPLGGPEHIYLERILSSL